MEQLPTQTFQCVLFSFIGRKELIFSYHFLSFNYIKMFGRMGFSESRYLNMLNLLCEYLNRTKGGPVREVKHGSGKYHYTEKLNGDVFYSCSFKSPMDTYDEIMRIAFNF